MGGRISGHIRSNVVGYIALFCFAMGGTASAIDGPLPGQNQVGSDDIINGEVKNADIGSLEVKANNIAPDSLGSAKIADRSVKNADLGLGASSSNTIADGGIQGVDVKNDTLTGGQVDESTLFNDNSLTGGDIDESTLAGVPSAPSGPAGGDLAGTYPNPTIGASAVAALEVEDQSLKGPDIGEGAIGPSELNSESVHGGFKGDVADDTLTGDDVTESTLFNDNSLTGGDIDESTLSGVKDVFVPTRTTLSDVPADAPEEPGWGPTTATLLNGAAFDIKGHCEEFGAKAGGDLSAWITLESTASDVTFGLENGAGRSSTTGPVNQPSPPPVTLAGAGDLDGGRSTDFGDFAAVGDSGSSAISGTVLAGAVNPGAEALPGEEGGTCVFSVAALGG